MQIVIDIPEELYTALINGYEEPYSRMFSDVVKNGTVLPKHGDLVARSDIEVEEDVYNQTYIIHAPTILKATMENSK